MTGLLVVAVVLVAAAAFGLWRKRTDGRMRDVAKRDGSTTVVPTPLPEDAPEAVVEDERLTAAEIGGPLGERATLVQFSSAFCQPCRVTRGVLGEVQAMVPGVEHIEIDAEQHLDLVRRLGIMRTPTTLVLDANGSVVKRAVGTPRKADVIAALGTVIGDDVAARRGRLQAGEADLQRPLASRDTGELDGSGI